MYFFMFVITLFLLIGYSECVTIKSNSPITIGTPITFEVNVETYASTSLLFIFIDNTKHKKEKRIVNASSILSQVFLYDKDDKINGKDEYNMTVKVYEFTFYQSLILIGENKTSFTLLDSLIVSLDVMQNNISHPLYLSSEFPTQLISSIKDPNKYFSNALQTYHWNITEDTTSTIDYNCTEGPLDVMLNVTFNIILKNITRIYNGIATISRKCLNPIKEIIMKKTHYIQIYKNMNIELSFLNATPPIYCQYTIYHDMSTPFIPIETETRQINFTHYFNKLGSYFIKIRCNNDISENSTAINFNVYDFTGQIPLYIVLLPIISIITAICIVFGVIALHLKYRKELTVEVADFDFQSYEDLMEKTFFERILDSLRFSHLWTRQRTCDSESNNLIEPSNENSKIKFLN